MERGSVMEGFTTDTQPQWEAFRFACYNGRLEMAQWIYSLGGVDYHAQDEWAFRWACYCGRSDIVWYLLQLGIPDSTVSFCLQFKKSRELLQQYIHSRKAKSARTAGRALN
jgi:hypothetical protein